MVKFPLAERERVVPPSREVEKVETSGTNIDVSK